MAIVRLDKVQASYNGNLESLRFATEKTNGIFVKLGGLVAGQREVRTALTPANIATDVIVLHATPEVEYDPRKSGLKNFTVKAGEEGRGYHLVLGDIITLTEDLVESGATIVLNDILTPQVGAEILEKPADPATSRLQLQVIEVTTLGYDNQRALALQVIKA